MVLVDIKSVKITEKGQIAIPKILRDSNFKEGSKIAIFAFDDRIELRPMNKIATAIASEKILSRDWNSREEDEAWKDL